MKKIYSILAVVAMATVANAQTNLVQNPSFEAGLAPWAKGPTDSYTEPTIVTTGGQEGNNYVTYAGASATTGFYQNVPVTEGKTYVITFWYKASGDGSDARLWSVYKNAGNGNVYTTNKAEEDQFRNNNKYLPTKDTWTKHTAEMPAGAGAASLDVAVRVYSKGSASFDSFEVYEKETMSVSDIKTLENSVKFNTVVDQELKVFTSERVTVNVYSLDGSLISSNRVSNGDSVNFSGVLKGNYIVIVDNGSTKFSKKIIKK